MSTSFSISADRTFGDQFGTAMRTPVSPNVIVVDEAAALDADPVEPTSVVAHTRDPTGASYPPSHG
jgi:hypothetical protein